ncbi:unnamed protein product [Arabis nemorensis]|uniref:Uncharacterized protein n=1 Tax=Arabis nemorensis TaxID=586526 RepID=A0A565BH96_9BRAS|nr:unnamed protein product [Arabis nemorensis]
MSVRSYLLEIRTYPQLKVLYPVGFGARPPPGIRTSYIMQNSKVHHLNLCHSDICPFRPKS